MPGMLGLETYSAMASHPHSLGANQERGSWMKDTAAFKFDSLPSVTFVATRLTAPETGSDGLQYPEGWLEITPHRDGSEEGLGSSGDVGPTAPPSVDKPFVPGGKVPFALRSLPGYTFYAARAEQEVIVDDPAGHKTRGVDSDHLPPRRRGRRAGVRERLRRSPRR